MAKRKLANRLIDKNDIEEELVLIKGSATDYITINGNVYTDYGNNKLLLRAKSVNKYNHYVYVNVRLENGKIKQKRLHKLIAETFIPNDDIVNKTIVMHIDNNKSNNKIENLKWGSVSENTKQAYDEGLAINAKGFEDSQSFPIVVLDTNYNLIDVCGSVSIGSDKYNVTKCCILFQCKHKVKNKIQKPRCGFYFRFLDEYEKQGFIL